MPKAPVLIDLKFPDREKVVSAMSGFFRNRTVIDLAEPENAKRDLSDCRYAVLWKPEADLFQRAPNLDVLFSGGAGVDKVLALEGLPDVPLVRFVDPTLTRRMSEYVVLQCLAHLRRAGLYARQQRDRIWREWPQPEAADVTIGVMGLGALGLDAAEKLKVMGFKVIGWSRSQKTIDGMETFDQDGLDVFLAKTDILVGLLPLTGQTTGLFNLSLFSKLKADGPLGGPVFINAGRGGSQVELDIVAALKDRVLAAVSLDVFETEPLSAESLLWDCENAILTPHIAADTDVEALFAHVEYQIERFEAGEALQHTVDRQSGY
ncbi:2-hydroxyacid dehydrogenase [Martelella mediterranea]|uniref:Glyoxylate/hydroxypyruvate reductase A n=1 Tax=Martelella mediterranea TaxID=293089 RepID=A0A4V2V4J9_9HYPH|nr:glyoxylate/hydroxypyruvate reductase A [Martelella mediterranea]TCT40220.1 glyoxylate/hydroxypyruvate reductase A [Martelella mediterranea]